MVDKANRSFTAKARRKITLWLRWFQRQLRITSPTPEALIDEIADRYGLEVVIIEPGETIKPEIAVEAIFAIAKKAGICVTLLCSLQNLKETLQRKIIHSRWN